MGYVRKTLRKEHETPKRSRFRGLLEQGYSQRDAARRLNLIRGTASKWVSNRHTGKGRTSRPPIILDEKVELLNCTRSLRSSGRGIANWIAQSDIIKTGTMDHYSVTLNRIARQGTKF